MTTTIQSGPIGVFDAYTRDHASPKQLLNLALFGAEKQPGDTDAEVMAKVVTAQNWLSRSPDFIVEANTDADETSTVIELIARGVTFPADAGGMRFIRNITVEAYASGNGATEGGFARGVATIQGGSTPTVLTMTNPEPVGTGAGLTAAIAVAFSAGSGVLNVQVNSPETSPEPVNWKVFVYVGKLIPVRIAAA